MSAIEAAAAVAYRDADIRASNAEAAAAKAAARYAEEVVAFVHRVADGTVAALRSQLHSALESAATAEAAAKARFAVAAVSCDEALVLVRKLRAALAATEARAAVASREAQVALAASEARTTAARAAATDAEARAAASVRAGTHAVAHEIRRLAQLESRLLQSEAAMEVRAVIAEAALARARLS